MGALLSFLVDSSYALLSQAFPPKSAFSVDQIPDLTGRVAIVTGKSLRTYAGLPITQTILFLQAETLG